MRRLLLLLAAFALAGCGGGGSATTSASDDAGGTDLGTEQDGTGGDDDAASGDAIADGDTASEGDSADTSDGGGGDAIGGVDPIAWGQGPLPKLDKPVQTAEAKPLAVGPCRVAAFFASDPDGVGAALSDGSATLPGDGDLAYGKVWKATSPNENGQFPAAGNSQGTTWTLCELAPGGLPPGGLAQAARLIAQVDRAYEIRWPGRRQPGDIYGSGRMRVPMRIAANAAAAAKVVIGVRGRGGQALGLRVWAATTGIALNPADTTAPDLRVGVKGELWLGMPVLELDEAFSLDVRAKVVESEHVAASEVAWPGLVPGGAAQIGWKIVPKAAPTKATDGVDEAGKPKPLRIPVTLQLHSAAHADAVQVQVELEVKEGEQPFRQTFRDKADASVQYYGVRPPRDFDPGKADPGKAEPGKPTYAMMLTLHGAGVEGLGQAAAYGAKTWLWHIAPTNRRPFGFDWEEWGHWNGIHALDDAMARFGPDPTQIYLGGHSMGGHGTWQFGVHHAGRFAVIGPSAGWDSFYTYGGAPKPTGPIGRARAHSDTSRFLENVRDRAVYVIHGTADDNVPWSEGKTMLTKASAQTSDVDHHWEQGAGHWWDGDKAEGADCVDWPPLFALMQQRKLDPFELSFHWRSPGPYYAHQHSYLTIEAASSPMNDTIADSVFDGAKLTLTLQNVRRARIDGAALRARGVQQLTWSTAAGAGGGAATGPATVEVPDGPLLLGDAGGKTIGKTIGQSGPFNQVFQRAFAFIVADDDVAARTIAAYWASSWQQIGNGHCVVLPASAAAHAVGAGRQLVWFGVAPPEALPVAVQVPGQPGAKDGGPTLAGATFNGAAIATVFPRGAGVDAMLWAPKDKLGLLYSLLPFSSRSGMPDYVVWDTSGLRAAGFWTSDWAIDPALAVGL